MPAILFLGVTGYIGSAVFNTIINAHPALNYTAIVRTPSHAAHIHDVNAVNGTLEDRALVTQFASKADIVINVARADDLGLIEALVEGLKRRKEETGKRSVLIHTLAGDAFEGRDTWDDTDEDCIRLLLNKPVEQSILSATRDGMLRAYFIAPAAVYGLNAYGKPSPFYIDIIRDALSLPEPNITSPHFHPLLASVIKERPNRVMGMVNIDDLANLYLLVLDSILHSRHLSESQFGIPASPPSVYIASSSERLCASVYDTIIRALSSRNLLPSSTPTLTPPGSKLIANESSETRFFLARHASTELGWTPSKPVWEHDVGWDLDKALEKLKVTTNQADAGANPSKNA
ncbi:uncharacterized protein FOMMEDRAFT_131316 [Fomitiporia mediterranea MF3/22]|uniref:uncharacterized protein n=1 Tax=Fomitiporia mediterranea (strain MF3/22) TaxID=694068 RepID=UPI00044073A1|nr:uncharacterized protein FOMMEDRAFT_131316 [Fomitiporia mediterranea MF3/22]EJD06300.1 hypothetical protein FOMMEDRAFT_131316 [Fomitiporia mediterranea MF3/22]